MMKYIHLELAGYILFEQGQKHSTMAKRFPTDTVISAGFVEGAIDKDQITCCGESSSLNKSSKPQDSDYVYRRLSIYA
jgi:hypothetical protein